MPLATASSLKPDFADQISPICVRAFHNHPHSDGKQAGPLMRLQHALVSLDASARPSCHDVLDRLDEMRLF